MARAASFVGGNNDGVRNDVLDRAGRATLESLEQRVLFAAGVLDTTFNGTGKVTTKYRSTNDGVAVAFQSDGKAVVVGDTQATGGSQDAFVSRYNTDGSVDKSFNNGGVNFLDLGADEVATGVAVQSDGKIVVVGVTGNLSSLQSNFFVARYNTDGTLDTSFNGTGTRTIDFGGGDVATGVAVTSNGRIIVVGTSLSGLSSGIAIAFLNSDGSFDTTFGPGQLVKTEGPGTFQAGTSIALAPTAGRFYVSGLSFNALHGGVQFMVAEFNVDGSFATSFGNQGEAFASFGNSVELATGVAVDPTTSKVVAAGTSANGIIDFAPGFPIGNLPTTKATKADFAVARFNTDGTLDSTFGNGGMTTTDFQTNGASNLDGASDVVVQADGKPVAAGGSEVLATGNSQFATARYNTDGTLDSTYASGGKVLTSFSSSTSDGAFGMGLQSDQKVYEVGHTKTNASNSSVAIVRYTSDSGTPAPVPTPAISVGDVSVKAPAAGTTGTADFTVALSAPGTGTVTVDFATADGTAKAGVDYVAKNGTLTFAPGETTKTVAVDLLGTGATSGSKTFTLDLSNPTSGTLRNTSGTATIVAGPTNQSPGTNVTAVKLGKVPKNVIGGQSNAVVPVKVTLTNTGPNTVKGKVKISLLGSTDQTANPATDLALGSITPNVNLAPGKSKTFSTKAKFPVVSSNQNLFVVALATGAGVTSTPGSSASSSTAVTVQQPVVTLVGTVTPQPLRKVKLGQQVSVKVPLTNNGNVTANGSGLFDLILSTDGTENPGSVLLTSTVKKSLNIGAHKKGNVTFNFHTPQSGTQLTNGAFTVLIRLRSTTLKNATNTTDGSLVAVVPFTIS